MYISGHDSTLGRSSDVNVKNKALAIESNSYTASDTITRPANTTAYDALDVVSTEAGEILTFTNIGGLGSEILINNITMRIDVGTIPSGMSTFKLHLYNTAPTAIADNATYNLPSGDRSKYLGSIDIPTPTDIGDTLWSQNHSLGIIVKLAANSTTLYGILQTVTGYTPSSGTIKTVTINSVGV